MSDMITSCQLINRSFIANFKGLSPKYSLFWKPIAKVLHFRKDQFIK